MIVLGISAFYHDSAAALVRDGEIIAAAQEERFTRKKNDSSFPSNAVRYCLDEAQVDLDAVDFIGFYDKPLLTFNRLVETYLAYAPEGFPSFVRSIPVWVKEKIFQKGYILKELERLDCGKADPGKVRFGFHHHSHAASAFYPSPFNNAAVLVMDGVGEWATTSVGIGNGNSLQLTKEIKFPHSLGLLYSAFTYYLGFKINDGEYRVMGLAPYGEPVYAQKILDNLIDIKPDGSFRLNMSYFNYCTGITMTNAKFDALFGGVPRNPANPLTQRHMDLARSVQVVTEELVTKICLNVFAETGERNLCMAGGVALNCVANGKILNNGPFDNIWVQPASGDAGASLGVALAISFAETDPPNRVVDGVSDKMKGTYLGPSYSADDIRATLDSMGAVYEEFSEEKLFETISTALDAGMAIGWFQGRMEFGPRALGNRSILGDARSANMQRNLNMKIKYRESFRPFAPAILGEDAPEYFEMDGDSPYMLFVSDVRTDRRKELSENDLGLTGLEKLGIERSEIPAVTHVDYSARVQTVHENVNPIFHRLLKTFKAATGCPLVVNTSFNVRDEPVVCSPLDAYRCFMATELDYLVIENFILVKSDQ